MLQKTKNKKIFSSLKYGLFTILGVLLPTGLVLAAEGFWDKLLRWMFLSIGYLFAFALEIEVQILLQVGKLFNHVYLSAPDIMNDPVVITGWGITRDVLNMFFVLILLVIAFATILRIESYQYKALLPKLIYGALLVNFSKTIAGIFIDFTNVLMKTFLNINEYTYADTYIMAVFKKDPRIVGGSAFTHLKDAPDNLAVVKAIVLATLISCIIMGLLTFALLMLAAMIIMRNVILMVLVVLSPVAFVLNILPKTEEHAKRWWDEFFKYAFYGPVAAFLVYLSCMLAYNITQDSSKGLLVSPHDIQGQLNTGKSFLAVDGLYRVAVLLVFLYMAVMMAEILAPALTGAVKGALRGAGGLAGKVGWWGAKSAGRWTRRRMLKMGTREGLIGSTRVGRAYHNALDKLRSKGRLGKAGALLAGAAGNLPFLGLPAGLRWAAKATLVPEAWRRRSARVEEEAMAHPTGEVYDDMNRFLGNERTRFAWRAKRDLELQKKQEIDTESSPLLVQGYLGATSQLEKMAYMRKLLETNNQNDLMSDPEFFNRHRAMFMRYCKKSGLNGSDGKPLVTEDSEAIYDPELYKRALWEEIGDGETIADYSEIAMENGHFELAGMSVPGEDGVFRESDLKTHLDVIEDKRRKMGNRQYMQIHSNGYFRENNGDLRGFHRLGKYLRDREDLEKMGRVGEYGRADVSDGYAGIDPGSGKQGWQVAKEDALAGFSDGAVKRQEDDMDVVIGRITALKKKVGSSRGKKKAGFQRRLTRRKNELTRLKKEYGDTAERMVITYSKACEYQRLRSGKFTDPTTGANIGSTDGSMGKKAGTGRETYAVVRGHLKEKIDGLSLQSKYLPKKA